MFNVCAGCGEYSAEKTIDANGPFAVCQQCGYRHPFVRLPLLIVTGASGTGKTTVALKLTPQMPECVCLESDVLWRDEFSQPDDDYRQYRELWLRVAKNIAQAGRPVVLFGSSTPGQFEQCTESRYFTAIHYLAFVCAGDKLVERLKARPGWRKSGSEETVKGMIDFNRWLTENAELTRPKMTLLDTSDLTLDESIESTRDWIKRHL